MHVACHHSEQWLRQTIRSWLAPACRHVSTSSAINRGLAATKRSTGGYSGGPHKRLQLPAIGNAVRSRPEASPGAQSKSRRLRGSRASDSRHPPPANRGLTAAIETLARPREAPAGRHETTPAALLLYLRRVRDLDRGLNVAWRAVHTAKVKEAIAHVNGTSHLLARVRSELESPDLERFGAVPGGPLVVHGATPPVVTRTALWLRPDSTLGLAFPPGTGSREAMAAEARPGLAGTAKRLSFLVREIQRLEAGHPNTPSPAPEIDEAQNLVKSSNLALQGGNWAAADVMRFVHMKLGRHGGLWSNERARSSKTYLHVSDRTVLDLVLPGQPETTMSVSHERETPKQREEKQAKPTTIWRQAETAQGPEKKQRQDQDAEQDDGTPLSIPYTTAASSFIYGSNAVLAALRARRRKLHHLYLHPRLSARESNAKDITDLAKQHSLRTTNNADIRLLDKMSDDRPHNGVVLEASRLPAPPLLSLAKPNLRTSIVPLVLDRQSAEDVAVNGAPGALPILTTSWRHPFVLMLDGIVDPGNVGNILRTAHFYGVDAVVIATKTCAPLTSAALAKASSGACEALRIFALPKPSNFVYDSAKAGWHIYAAVAPGAQRPAELRRPRDYEKNVTTAGLAQSSPLARHPVILMLGAEGEGLRESLKNKANHFLTIEQGSRAFDVEDDGDVGVDSLNVGVAAGVLVEAFMRKPEGAEDLGNAGELGF